MKRRTTRSYSFAWPDRPLGAAVGMMAKWSLTLAVVEHALGGRCSCAGQRLWANGPGAMPLWPASRRSGAHGGQVVLGQVARIGTRVGQGLVLFVQAWASASVVLAEAEAAVGLALQAGQVKQQAAGLGGGLGFFADAGGLALHGVGNGLAFGLRPHGRPLASGSSAFLNLGVEPLARVLARPGRQRACTSQYIAALEGADFSSRSTTSDNSVGVCTSPRWSKEAAIAGELKAVMARVPLMPTIQSASGGCGRRIGQRAHLRIAAQVVKSRRGWPAGVMDCSHRRCTGLPRRLLAPGVLLRSGERSARPRARVAGVDDVRHVLALGLLDHRQPRLGLVDGPRLEVRRNHRQVGKAPLLPRLTSNSSGAAISTRWPTATTSPRSGRSRNGPHASQLARHG